MKKLFILFIFLLSTLTLLAQVPTPFVADGQQKCVGTTVVYGPQSVDPSITYSYSISPPIPFTPISGGDQIQVTWNTPGTYSITITSTDANGCSSTSTSIINVVPALTIQVTNQTVCENSLPFNLVSNSSGVTWSGIGVLGNQFDPSGLSPGDYVVNASYIDANGCIGNGSGTITITPIPPTPILNSN